MTALEHSKGVPQHIDAALERSRVTSECFGAVPKDSTTAAKHSVAALEYSRRTVWNSMEEAKRDAFYAALPGRLPRRSPHGLRRSPSVLSRFPQVLRCWGDDPSGSPFDARHFPQIRHHRGEVMALVARRAIPARDSPASQHLREAASRISPVIPHLQGTSSGLFPTPSRSAR